MFAIFQPNQQTLEGSFSSASKPIFATKYSYFSIFRGLKDLQSFAPLRSQKLKFSRNLSNFYRIFAMFVQILKIAKTSRRKVANLLNLERGKEMIFLYSRSRKILQIEYLVAKIGFGTDESEPSQVRLFHCFRKFLIRFPSS